MIHSCTFRLHPHRAGAFYIFSHHVVSYKDRASGAEGSAEVCGLFKCGTDLIFECNEMTTVTRGAMGADLGSATA